MKNALNATQNTDRASFAVAPIAGGFTRMCVGDGNAGTNAARLYRTDDAVTRDRRELHRPDSTTTGVVGTEPNTKLLH